MPSSTMHEATDIFSKFQQFWQSGINAYLNLECRDGLAWLQLQVALPPPQPHQYQDNQHYHKPCPSPSRRRRRAKRYEARVKAAAAVKNAANSIEVSTQTHKNRTESVDVAIQATVTNKLDELGHHQPPAYLRDEVCHDHVYEEAAVQADFPPQLLSSIPANTDPQSPAIPQLDGMIPDNLIFQSNSHPYFSSLSHTRNRSAEERRKEQEKDLENIKKMIQDSCRF